MGEGDHVRQQGVELSLHPPRPGDHELARLGQAGVRTIHELAAELTLELFHVRGDVGLHGLERVCGRRERTVIGDGDEGAQLAEVHRNQRYRAIDKNCLTDAVKSRTMYCRPQ